MRLGIGSLLAVLLLWIAVHETIGVTYPAAAVSAAYVISALVVLLVVSQSFGFGWVFAGDAEAFATLRSSYRAIGSPIIGGLVGNPVLVMIERVLVATIGPGSVATIAYARGIASAPSMISQAVGSAAYPGMVRAGVAEERGAGSYLRSSFLIGLRLTLLAGGAAAIYFAVFAHAVTSFLLERGALNGGSVARTSEALAAFALSTLATSLLMYVVPVLYGVGRSAGILQRSLVVFGAYVVLAPLLLWGWGEAGVAIAFSLAQTVGAAFAVAIVIRHLAISAHDLARSAFAPIAWRLGALAAVLIGWRWLVGRMAVSGQTSHLLLVAGGAALTVVLMLVLFAVGRSPEAWWLRALRPGARTRRSARESVGRES